MTPEEVRKLSVPEYMALLRNMDEENRALRRAQAKRKGR